MKISNNGLTILKTLEGVRNEAYKDCAGLLTIGVGHLLTQSELSSGKVFCDGNPIYWRDGISEEEIDIILDNDLKRFELNVDRLVTVGINKNQFDALVSFSFNVGEFAFAESTLLKMLNNREYIKVPNEMSRWVFSGGKKVNGLISRRVVEATLWSSSVGLY